MMLAVTYLIATFLLIRSTPVVSKNASEYRLPGTTIPSEYNLTLTIDPDRTFFHGQVTIRIRTTAATNQVVLHAYDRMNITSHSIRKSDSTNNIITTLSKSGDDRQFVTLLMEQNLVENEEYILSFEYESLYRNLEGPDFPYHGLYRASYLDQNGTTAYMAVTQFEATSAREAFPCYDEPALKAVFNIHIYTPPKFTAISNMDVISSGMPPIDGYKVTSFRTTPAMSTYLVAFAIADYEYLSNTEEDKVIFSKEFRIYAKPGSRSSMELALDFGQKAMEFMENYTGVTYRLPKVDNIAVRQFDSGGMENWGLITYEEQYLLRYEGISTTDEEKMILVVIAHEVAHFWFGDEVSPLWWDYVWLNEGFARFFENYSTDQILKGEWRLMEEFVVNTMHAVLKLDFSPNIKPMTTSLGSPKEITDHLVKNPITYDKSASVIRMIQLLIGELRFKSAISNYIKSLPTGNAEPKNLFEALQGVIQGTELLPSGVTMMDVFGSWSTQAGYPIVYASRFDNNLILTQARYYHNNNLTSNESWWIPITHATSSKPFQRSWLRADYNLTIPMDADDEWYILNEQQGGYYRVMYDLPNWRALVQALTLNHTRFHPLNRAQLIDDAAEFAETGRLHMNVSLDLLLTLANDDDWIPWVAASRLISFLNTKMSASTSYSSYMTFIEALTYKLYESVGFNVNENDGYVTKQKRVLALNITCYAGNMECWEKAAEMLSSSLKDPKMQIHPDLKPYVYCYGIKFNENLWSPTLLKYTNASDSEKSLIISSLGCSLQKSTIERYLMMVVQDDSIIRPEDRESLVQSVMNSGPDGVGYVIRFMNQEFYNLRSKLPSPASAVRLISNLGNLIIRMDDVDAFNEFVIKFQGNLTSEEIDQVLNALVKIKQNQEWLVENLSVVEIWLEDVLTNMESSLWSSIVLPLITCLFFLKNVIS